MDNLWTSICIQEQLERSVAWDAYDETVRQIVAGFVPALSELDLEAIWLTTDAGIDWWIDQDESPSQGSEQIPVNCDDVSEHILKALYSKACDWSNQRIRRELERWSEHG